MNPFDAAARWIVARMNLQGSTGRFRISGKNEKLNRELMELGTGKKNCVQNYYVKKISGFLMITLVCAAVLTAVLVAEHRQDRRITDGVLERPGYGEDGRDQSLLLSIGSEESESIDVHLDARTYTTQQVKALLKDAAVSLEEVLPGENTSLDEVRRPLCLPALLEDGAVSVEYYFSPGDMIAEDGSICGDPEKDGTLVTISAALSCQKKTSTYECAAMIYPPVYTPGEQLRANIYDAVEHARTADPTSPQVKLPDSVDGRKL